MKRLLTYITIFTLVIFFFFKNYFEPIEIFDIGPSITNTKKASTSQSDNQSDKKLKLEIIKMIDNFESFQLKFSNPIIFYSSDEIKNKTETEIISFFKNPKKICSQFKNYKHFNKTINCEKIEKLSNKEYLITLSVKKNIIKAIVNLSLNLEYDTFKKSFYVTGNGNLYIENLSNLKSKFDFKNLLDLQCVAKKDCKTIDLIVVDGTGSFELPKILSFVKLGIEDVSPRFNLVLGKILQSLILRI